MVLLSVIITGLLILVNTVIYVEVDETIIPQSTYLIIVIALFFIDVIAFMFLQIDYASDCSSYSKFILSIAFLSSLVYLAETVIIIQQPVKALFSVQVKANDTAIFYLFRQISFVFLLFIALIVDKTEHILKKERKRVTMLLILCVIPVFFLPIIAHNLSSYNENYTLMLTDFSDSNGKAIWDVRYINGVIIIWACMSLLIVKFTKLSSSLWNSMAILCLSALVYNFFLLFLDKYNLSIWYISRVIEVFSKIFVIGTLMYTVFARLKIVNFMIGRDFMTQLYNRDFFYEKLERLAPERGDKSLCIMILDLDNFKEINDIWGHHIGDRVIMAIVDIIKKCIRADDVFSRLGGEEFGLVLRNISVEESENIALKICSLVKRETGARNIYNIPRVITITIGGVYISHGAYLPSRLKQLIDEALNEAKNNGKDGFVMYTMS
ncbi:diguanylate cyclase [Escherichia coli]|nr:diguanylate cyclase [Escherichia coli]